MQKDITSDFWDYIEAQKEKTKIAKKIYHWLDCDNLEAIQLDDKVFWFELTCPSTNTMPNFVYKYIKVWGKRLGYTYLYDLKTNY